MKTKTQAIAEFLETQDCKLNLYNPNMEVQVNVCKGPNRAKSDSSKILWEDGEYIWGPFRIPYNSNSDPYYHDTTLSWPLERYVEAIGCTGWDWFNRQSLWVGFDFDSIIGHSVGLTHSELDQLRDRVSDIPWIELRKSKSGRGFHLYIHFELPVPTDNHTEHAALARAILSQLSGLLDFNFESKVDTVGGVLWIWHKDASHEQSSFKLIKKRSANLVNIPANWRDHIGVTLRSSKTPGILADNEAEFNSLLIKLKKVKLTESHRQLLNWFANQNVTWWWDAERNMLVCHTFDLKRAHKELKLKGIFHTLAEGKDVPQDQNCFCFPVRDGAWVVRRHGIGTREHPYWIHDQNGWTKCYFNRLPDLESVARIHSGIKTAKNSFQFPTFLDAYRTLVALGVKIEMEPTFQKRQTELCPGKHEGEIIIKLPRVDIDPALPNYYAATHPMRWERVVECIVPPDIIDPPDEILRHAVEGNKSTWFIKSREEWIEKPKTDIKDALISIGYRPNEVPTILGKAVFDHWEIVTLPFQPEYPGDRTWNKNAPQLITGPKAGPHPTWDKILKDIGRNIDVTMNDWCLVNNIASGAEYLLMWIASLIRHPTEPLPYLFLFSQGQNTGKSTLPESISLLFKNGRGYIRAEQALTNPNGYNGELAGAVVCVIEELNLNHDKRANERIKDWVTAKILGIRPLYGQTYTCPNTTHWIQCANDPFYCPVFPGDTRITVIQVDGFEGEEIPKKELIERLQNEVPYFINTLLKINLPESKGRLRIPVIDSDIKTNLEDINRDPVDSVIREYCSYSHGTVVQFSELYEFIRNKLDPLTQMNLSSKKFAQSVELTRYVKGRWGAGGQIHIGNIKVEGLHCIQVKDEPMKLEQGRLK